MGNEVRTDKVRRRQGVGGKIRYSLPHDRGALVANRPLLSPPRLRPSPWEELHTTWLELFYDLVVAVAVTQVAIPLSGVLSRTVISLFFGLFLLVWWVWTGHTVYTTRFETDEPCMSCSPSHKCSPSSELRSPSPKSVSETPVALRSPISPPALSSWSS